MAPALTDPFHIGDVRIPNRLVLAPLAGIGNWFVRLQAKRYGAGLAVSEMVSSFGVHYGNEKTCVEMLRIHPDAGLLVAVVDAEARDHLRHGEAGPVALGLEPHEPVADPRDRKSVV